MSGVVRKAFRRRGHDAWSCDLYPAEDGSIFHFQEDVFGVIEREQWDLAIFHPPCTFLTVTGNKWFKPEYADRFPNRIQDREDAVEFFLKLSRVPIEKIAIENPIGIISTRWRKPDQVVHPWQFGHEVAKSTCLWLKNLPLLRSTKIVEPDYITTKGGNRISKWYTSLLSLPKEERTKARSRTFEGIAEAMAEQWG